MANSKNKYKKMPDLWTKLLQRHSRGQNYRVISETYYFEKDGVFGKLVKQEGWDWESGG